MLKCDLCDGIIGVTHLLTISLKEQADRFGKNYHAHICLECVENLYPKDALKEISKVEEKIFSEVVKKREKRKDEN